MKTAGGKKRGNASMPSPSQERFRDNLCLESETPGPVESHTELAAPLCFEEVPGNLQTPWVFTNQPLNDQKALLKGNREGLLQW